jgi:hypothetical protein
MRDRLMYLSVIGIIGGVTMQLTAQGLLLLGAGPMVLNASVPPELSAGDVVIRVSGPCGAGFAEVAALNGVFLRGTVAANADQGQAGGSDLITPQGTNSAPALTMNSYTPQGSNAPVSFTPAGSNGAQSFTGTPSSCVANHVHPYRSLTATTGSLASYEHGAVDTSSNSAVENASIGTENPTGGQASCTPAGTVSAAVFTGTPGSVPAQAFTGAPATLTGAVGAPVFTGTSFDNKPAFTKVIFCAKT